MNGLYSARSSDSKVKGKDLFDVSLFNNANTTSTFYKFMAGLRETMLAAEPTPTHKFLRLMKDQGTLLRSYTQNIDGLESKVGLNLATQALKANDVIQLHGDVHSLKCFLCSEPFAYSQDYNSILQEGQAPECPTCADKCAIRVACGRRPIAIGTLRPDIVLYGENHPSGDVIARACSADLKRKPDCLIIAGTSLKVPGFKTLIKDFAREVHSRHGKVIFLNLSEVGTSEWSTIIDYHVQGSSDDFVDFLKHSRPSYFTRQTTLDSIRRTRGPNRVVSSEQTKQKVSDGAKGTRSSDCSITALSIVPPQSRNCSALHRRTLSTQTILLDKSALVKEVSSRQPSEDKENINPLKRARAEDFLEDSLPRARRMLTTN